MIGDHLLSRQFSFPPHVRANSMAVWFENLKHTDCQSFKEHLKLGIRPKDLETFWGTHISIRLKTNDTWQHEASAGKSTIQIKSNKIEWSCLTRKNLNVSAQDRMIVEDQRSISHHMLMSILMLNVRSHSTNVACRPTSKHLHVSVGVQWDVALTWSRFNADDSTLFEQRFISFDRPCTIMKFLLI
jgi:hypothetical protein